MKWKNKGHEFDEIGYLLKGKENIFIYGAGGVASELLEILHAIQPWVGWKIYFVDKDKKKQKEGISGYEVLSPEDFFTMKKEKYFVVAGTLNKIGEEICSLVKERLGEDTIVLKGMYFMHQYLSIYFAYIHDMVFFASESMLPTTVCNLNCRDCLNFTPYIKKHYVESLETLKEDVDLFFNAVDLVYRFQITGGEPLLYKNLIPLIEYIDQNYRKKILRFEIVTNGTIIPDERICEILKRKDIYVFLDDYRMSVPEIDEIYERTYFKLKEHGISFADNHVETWMRMYMPDKSGEMESVQYAIQKKYLECEVPWSSLWHGKISSCNYAMYASKAGICEAGDDETYDLNLFSPEKKKELIEFRLRCCEKGYMEFCRMCNGWINTNKHWCKPAIQCERRQI